MKRLAIALAPVLAIGCGVVQEFGTDDPVTSRPDAAVDFPGLDGAATAPRTFSWLNPTPTGNSLHGIWGTADDDIWMAGDHGTILRWDGTKVSVVDAGRSDLELYAMWGSGKNDMWIAGRGGAGAQALHWDGTAWSSAYTLGEHNVHSLWGAAPNDVWALAEGGTILHFDASAFRVSRYVDPGGGGGEPEILRDLWGTSPTDVWAVGEGGAIYHLDGSGAWTPSTTSAPGLGDPFATTNAYRGVWGSSANDVWAVFVDSASSALTLYGGVGFSHFDGSAWRVTQREEGGVHEEGLAPTRRGHRVWGSGPNDILALTDSTGWRWNGTAWKSLRLATGYDGGVWEALWGSASRGIITVGPYGAVGRLRNDGTFQEVFPSMRSSLSSVSVAPDRSVWGVAGEALVRWTASGWAKASPLPVAHVAAVSSVTALSEGDVWVGATGRDGDGSSPSQNYGFVVRYRKGGPEAEMRVPLQSVIGLWAGDPTDAWAVGEGGAARWDGTSWNKIPGSGDRWLTGVSGTAANDVWISGDGAVFHWDGTALKEVHRSSRAGGQNIWASGPNDVWVGGQPGMRWNGKDWRPIASTDYMASSLWGTGPNDVWLVSNSPGRGTVRHWDGTALSTTLTVSPGLRSVAGSGASDVWFVGNAGATLHYADADWKGPR